MDYIEGSLNEKQYFEKSLKIYDELENSEDNVINIIESSNMQIGTGSRVWECVINLRKKIVLKELQGIILGKYAIKQNDEKGLFKKNVILELGAGTGLLAIMLASLGKSQFLSKINRLRK